MIELNKIYNSECLEFLKQMPDNFIDCCITSPPYWGLRDYGHANQLGLEPKFEDYIQKLIDIFIEVKRVLKSGGTCFVNIGDTYGGSGKGVGGQSSKELFNFPTLPKVESDIASKCLCQIPARFSLAMTDNGWILRNEIVWHKPNSMPTSASDRFTVDFEKIYFFVKHQKYYFEQQLEKSIWANKDNRFGKGKVLSDGKCENGCYAINGVSYRDDGNRNMRTTWSINTQANTENHFAIYPEALVSRMIKAGCPKDGIVYDPFMGAGTTALVAYKLDRNYIGTELNSDYCEIAEKRLLPHKLQQKLEFC